jgi:dimethylglycine dehydrogenase
MGRYQGMDLDILSPDEIKSRYPFAETHDLTGALYDPNDGDIDPAQLTQALAKGARDLGAKIYRFCPATGARREKDEWVISTEKGEIRCEYVVNAAGYYAREVGKMFGRDVPMMVMSHQYMLFDEVPEVAAWTAEAGHKLPLLRDVDSSYYLRQEKNGFNLGPYERNCKAHWVTPDDPMPEDFSFQLYPDDLERLEWYINDACERVPLLGTAGLTKNINGPIPYTPDGNPLIGPMPGVPNAFEACVFTFGICQGGGAGKVLAEWVMEGETEWDMWSCDPRRFTAFCDQDYCVAKGMEVYGHEYGMHFPHHAWPAGRNKKLSPVHDRVAELGAQFGAYNGWERANWYARPGDDVSEEATQTWAREGSGSSAVREECQAVRDAAGILDLPGFSRFRVEGPGARDWLSTLITGMVPKPGRIGLGYFADGKGRIVTEMSLMALDEDFFFLITAATAQLHDYEWLVKHLPAGSEIAVEDVTEAFSCQILTGPKSREILSGITDADLSKAWLTHQSAQVDGTWCQLVRVSFAGELGWEIHSKTEDTPKIFDAVMKAGEPHGLKPFGMFALNSLRLEKGYRAWKGDLSTDYTVLQGGLDRFVKWDKPDFLGKQALEAEKQQGVSKRFVTLVSRPATATRPTCRRSGMTASAIALWSVKPRRAAGGTVIVGECASLIDRARCMVRWRDDLVRVMAAGVDIPAPGWKSRSSVNALPPRLSRISRCGIPRTKDCGHECDCSSKCPRGHCRRRCFRLFGGLSPRQAGLARHRAARTQATDLRHYLACGRPDRAIACLDQHDPARQVFRRSLRQA